MGLKKNGEILDIRQLQLIGFADWLDVERSKSLTINSKFRTAFYCMRKTRKGAGLGEITKSSVWGILRLRFIVDKCVELVSMQLID